MFWPMFVLTRGVAILGVHTFLARLETDAPFLAALGAAGADLVHLTGCQRYVKSMKLMSRRDSQRRGTRRH